MRTYESKVRKIAPRFFQSRQNAACAHTRWNSDTSVIGELDTVSESIYLSEDISPASFRYIGCLYKDGRSTFTGNKTVPFFIKWPESTPDRKIYSGTGTVNGKKKIAAEFEGEIIPFEEIEDINEQRKFFRLLTRE